MLSDNDTVETTSDAVTETPAQTAQPIEMPPTGSSQGGGQHSAGWFSRVWRCGVAAAVIVLVAGAFFAIGWFTSTRGDDGHPYGAKQFNQQSDLRERGFQRGGAGQQGPGQWQGQRYPDGQSQSNGQPNLPTPSSPQAPSSQQGYLGVGIATVTPALQQQYGLSKANGVLVVSVDGSGPASKAGILQGDVITSIDGTPVATREDVISVVAKKNPGDSVSVVVDRNGQSLTFQVTLETRPATTS